jgi:hypothetical protein
MQRHAAIVELVEGCELTRQQRRRGEAGPLRDHHFQLPGDAEHMLGNLQCIRRGRMKRQ